MKKTNRQSFIYFIAIIIVIFLGLGSREINIGLPVIISSYPGDILWALMIFLIFCGLFTRASTKRNAICGLLLCYLVEFIQLYKAPWIQNIRGTKIGRYVLGLSFSYGDLIAYTIGIIIGVILDRVYLRHLQKR